jgi:hypothetical protein
MPAEELIEEALIYPHRFLKAEGQDAKKTFAVPGNNNQNADLYTAKRYFFTTYEYLMATPVTVIKFKIWS